MVCMTKTILAPGTPPLEEPIPTLGCVFFLNAALLTLALKPILKYFY